MIILTLLLYFPVLFLVYYARVMLAGMGIFLDLIPTALIHTLVFLAVATAVKFVRKLICKRKNVTPKKDKNLKIYGLVTVGFTVMYALNSYGILTRAVSGYLVPICAYIVLAISLNLVVGISGELSLGHAGFMGIGAFAGIVAAACLKPMIADPFVRLVLAMFVGGGFAGVFGFIIGIPVLRLRGDYLAIVTLAFGEILKNVINTLYVGLDSAGLHLWMDKDAAVLADGGKMIIDGAMGAKGVERISTFFAGFLLILFALVVILNLIYSKEGRAIKAVRDNRIAAESVGINVTAFRLKAFVISAFLAGMAGALFGLNYGSTAPAKFSYNTSIDILVYVVLGGMGNIFGSIISTVTLYLVPEFLREMADLRMIMYAIVLIVVMLFTWSPKFKLFIQSIKGIVTDKILVVFKKRKKEVAADE